MAHSSNNYFETESQRSQMVNATPRAPASQKFDFATPNKRG